jgi:N-acetylglucosamine repressor
MIPFMIHTNQTDRNCKFVIKKSNRKKILQLIWEKGAISRAEIAKQLHLTPATISSNVAELVKQKFVRMAKTGDSSGGRKPVIVEIDDRTLFCIGVSVRKTEVVSALVSLKGEVSVKFEKSYPVPLTTEKILLLVIESVRKVISGVDLQKMKILGIGIGMHGIVDFETGVSIFAPAFNWHNINIKKLVADAFHIPVIVDNDVRVMVLAELWFGKWRSLKNFIFLSLGSGVGGGILLNGKLFRGNHFAAGEFGHIRVNEHGTKCVCGNYGCLDTVASEQGLIDDVIERIHLGYSSVITDFLDGNNLEHLTFDVILRAANTNDVLAIEAFQKLGMYVGTALANIINIFNPEAVIIGGNMSRAWNYIEKPILNAVSHQSMKECNQGVRILKSSFEGMCGEIGAATLIIDNLFQ